MPLSIGRFYWFNMTRSCISRFVWKLPMSIQATTLLQRIRITLWAEESFTPLLCLSSVSLSLFSCHNLTCAVLLMSFSVALRPSHHEILVSWSSLPVKWYKLLLFPASCTWMLFHITRMPQYKQLDVTFHDPFPAVKYGFKLGSNCTGSRPFWTHSGNVETEVGGKENQMKVLSHILWWRVLYYLLCVFP